MASEALTVTGSTTEPNVRVLVVANGQPPSSRLFARLQRHCGMVACVDGGANWACAKDFSPAMVLGDCDSISPRSRKLLKGSRWVETPDQEYSDLDKALAHLIGEGWQSISVAGVMGRRVDHSIANIGLLLKYRGSASITYHAASEDIFLLQGRWESHLRVRRRVSLLPVFGPSRVTTLGLRYPLSDEILEMGIRDGLSNEAAGGDVRVTCDRPLLVVVARSASAPITFAPEQSVS